jgi:hypothetical protein
MQIDKKRYSKSSCEYGGEKKTLKKNTNKKKRLLMPLRLRIG